jgi:hypothetical protein
LLIAALVGLVVFLFLGRWPHKLAILPPAVALWVAALFFGYPSPLIAAVVALAALVVLAWNYLSIRTGRSVPAQAPA